jgi:uncharacterized protein YndB with AHSA1/START domain
MTEIATPKQTLVVEREMAHPPEKMWRALRRKYVASLERVAAGLS